MLMGMIDGKVTVASAGGGAAVLAVGGTNSGGITAAPWTAGTFSFSPGLAVVGLVTGRSGGFANISGVTISGIAASSIGGGTATNEFTVSLWQAAVSSAGTVVVTSTGASISNTCICAWSLTGLGSNTATQLISADNYTSPHNDPQSLGALTVNTGGVGVVFIGADFKSSAVNPTIWANATRDSTTENSDGNFSIAGAHVTGASTAVITATATSTGSADWNFNGMQAASWA
jgi:hypothetical protein